VNQACFAVLAMRLPSLTRPAAAGLFQAFGFPELIRIPAHACSLYFRFGENEASRSRADHPDFQPG